MFVGTVHILGIYTARLKNNMKNVQADINNNVHYFFTMSQLKYFENILKYCTDKWDV